MIRIVYILAFLNPISGNIFPIMAYPFNLKWSFDANEDPAANKSKVERLLCDSEQCNVLAKILTESMNKSVDPCEDFYEYACGNWKMYNPLPKNEERWNLLRKSQTIVDKRLQDIIEADSRPDDLLCLRLYKRAYKACINTDELEKEGLQPIVSTMWRIGGWPLIMEEDEWSEEIYKWQLVDDYYARLTGFNSLYNVEVGDFILKEVKYLRINTPDLPRKMYQLVNSDEVDFDSDEDDDSQEGSQERGSEEEYEEENVSEEIEYDDEDSIHEDELERRNVAKRINKRFVPNKRKSNKIKHISERKMRKRTKSTSKINTKVHGKKQLVQRVIAAHRVHRGKTKMGERLSKRIQTSFADGVNVSVRKNNQKRKREIISTNSDIYFDETDNEDKDNNGNEDKYDNDDDEEVDEGNGNTNSDNNEWDDEGSNGSDNNESNNENGRGSGDNEWDYENGSGGNGSSSGDDEWDDENGSGSDDDEWDDENGSGGGDDEWDDKNEKKKQEVEKLRKKYAEYILNVSIALTEARGVPIPKQKLKEDIDGLIKFQLELIKIIFMDYIELEKTLLSFQKSYDALNPTTNNGKINWIKKVQDLFATGGMEVDSKTVILTPSNNYVKNLRKLLDKTSSRTIVNYIHWFFLSRAIKATTKQMRDFYHNWESNNVNVKKRSDECITEKAKYCFGYEYVRRHVPEETIKTASDMIDDIQKEVEYQIKDATWMNDRTKDFILGKLVYMKKLIGYSDDYRNITAMKIYFQGLAISQSHYENVLSIMRHTKQENLRMLFTDEKVNRLFIDPLIVNAFFMPMQNTIEITAADFQNPLFESQHPWYTNFGIIGFVMAHEVNHGFDNMGYLYDKHGNYKGNWASAMANAYDKRAECFEFQFTKYSVKDNKTANTPIQDYGKQTEGENIADSMGLQSVFRAYQRRQRECKNPDPMLPGLQSLTNEQMFFLSFANLWCEAVDPKAIMVKLKHDRHSLGPLRVIGSVSNSEDFAKVYNCPKGSPMNPKRKCSIWK